MNSLSDYDSLGYIMFGPQRPHLLEAFLGTAVVAWQGRIERQLVNMLDNAEKSRNYPYADKLREFLKIWRENEITGSINRETLEILKSSADILAVDNWNLSHYFSSLRDQLKVLIASEEQLPRVPSEPGETMPSALSPTIPSTFGPEERPPSRLSAPPSEETTPPETPPSGGTEEPVEAPEESPRAVGFV